MEKFFELGTMPEPMELNELSFILTEGRLTTPVVNGVASFVCKYDNKLFKESLFEQLNVTPGKQLQKAVQKRKAEYVAGRYCARKVLEQLGVFDFEVRAGANRCPLWPSGILGSITHTSTHAIAIATRDNNHRFVGVDYEKLIDSEVANTIHSKIINNKELELILADEKMSFDFAITLIFSAKESLFKALFPLIKKYFDFDSAEIINYSEKHGSFTLRLCESLSDKFKKGALFNGRFEFSESYVLTIIAE